MLGIMQSKVVGKVVIVTSKCLEKNATMNLNVMAYACNHSTWMVEAGEFKGFFQNGPEF